MYETHQWKCCSRLHGQSSRAGLYFLVFPFGLTGYRQHRTGSSQLHHVCFLHPTDSHTAPCNIVLLFQGSGRCLELTRRPQQAAVGTGPLDQKGRRRRNEPEPDCEMILDTVGVKHHVIVSHEGRVLHHD